VGESLRIKVFGPKSWERNPGILIRGWIACSVRQKRAFLRERGFANAHLAAYRGVDRRGTHEQCGPGGWPGPHFIFGSSSPLSLDQNANRVDLCHRLGDGHRRVRFLFSYAATERRRHDRYRLVEPQELHFEQRRECELDYDTLAEIGYGCGQCQSCLVLIEALREHEQQCREFEDRRNEEIGHCVGKTSEQLALEEEIYAQTMRKLKLRRDCAFDVLVAHQRLEHR